MHKKTTVYGNRVKQLQVKQTISLKETFTYLQSFCSSILQSLMVHSVNLRESEIQMYPPNGLSIAHCPATLWKYV